jgi:hypothetical protein
MIEPVTLECPYCGETFETVIDRSAGDQSYVEDCPVCCRPIEVAVRLDNDGSLFGVEVRREDD